MTVVNLDYQPAVAQRAGIGRYTRLLAHYLPDALGPDVTLRLFYFDFTRRAEPPDAPGAEARPWRLLPGAVAQQLWKRGLPPRYDRLAGRADLYHFANFIIPPISTRAKTVATIFDMSFLRHPECAEARNLAYMGARIGKTVERADAILTISRYSASEIESFFPAARGKVFPVYLGVDQSLSSPGRDAINDARRRLGLERPYILSVGTIEPRKNYPLLVDAFEHMKNDVDLVVAGRPGWRYEPILERFRSSQKASRIHFLGPVGDTDLAALYAGAEIFAFPSLYEGFGLPPLEAMRCGTPVAASSAGSLREILGDAAVIVPDYEPETWAFALDRLVEDRRIRGELRSKGFATAARFRWEETARGTAAVYRAVLGGNP